jgi:hypothetical protein
MAPPVPKPKKTGLPVPPAASTAWTPIAIAASALASGLAALAGRGKSEEEKTIEAKRKQLEATARSRRADQSSGNRRASFTRDRALRERIFNVLTRAREDSPKRQVKQDLKGLLSQRRREALNARRS